jgi:hypothetical protein
MSHNYHRKAGNLSQIVAAIRVRMAVRRFANRPAGG